MPRKEPPKPKNRVTSQRPSVSPTQIDSPWLNSYSGYKEAGWEPLQARMLATESMKTGYLGGFLPTGLLQLPGAQTMARAAPAVVGRPGLSRAQGLKNMAKGAGIMLGVGIASNVFGAGVSNLIKKSAPVAARFLARKNLTSELAPGQNAVFHFSHIPDLKTIEDVPGMRNTGANFGTPFDSTKFTGEGVTYAYTPGPKSLSHREIQGLINEAAQSKASAAAKGEIRDYTLYVNKGNPFKELNPTGKVVGDPEYATHNKLMTHGESVYGKQDVVTSFRMQLDEIMKATENYYDVMTDRRNQFGPDAAERIRAAEKYLIGSKISEANRLAELLSTSKKAIRAGIRPFDTKNFFGDPKRGSWWLRPLGPDGAELPEIPMNPPVVKPVSEVITNIGKRVGSAASVGGFVVQNAQFNKKRNGRNR